MKVLWFTNSPIIGSQFLDPTKGMYGGGWLVALEKSLREIVDLHIAYYYPKMANDFVYEGVHNYPICNKNWKVQMLKSIIKRKFVDEDDLQVYLNIINKVKPDIIHIHGTENPFGVLNGNTSIPIVTSIQGIVSIISAKYGQGIPVSYLKNRLNILKDGLLKTLLHKTFYSDIEYLRKMSYREAKNLLNSHHIIGRTDWDRRITSILAPNSSYYHCDEIMRDCFYNVEWKHKGLRDKFVIYSTSKDSALKGFETICETLFVLQKIGYTQLEWRIGGIHPDGQIVSIVQKLLKHKYPDKGLILLGSLNENQLLENILDADMYVMTSHIENSPNNLCEAMIIGAPCIATFVGGTSSIMENGKEGVLIQNSDPLALAGAIKELLNDQPKLIQIGRNAREKALKRHSKENNVKRLMEIYNNMLSV